MYLPKNCLLICAFLFPCLGINQINIDSLWTVWNDDSQKSEDRLSAIKSITWNGYLSNNPDSAYYFSGQHFDFAAGLHDKKEMATALYIMANAAYRMGNDLQGVEKAEEALVLYKEANFESGLANTYNLIGNICLSQKQREQARTYYLKSLEIYRATNDLVGKSNVYNNIGNVTRETGNYLDALDYYLKSLKLKKELENKRGIATTYANIGNTHWGLGDFTKAEAYYYKGLLLNQEINNKYGICQAHINISSALLKQGKHAEAITEAEKGLDLAKQTKAMDLKAMAHKILYDSYRATGKTSESLGNYEKYILFKDSLDQLNADQNLQRMKIQEEYKLKKQHDEFEHELELKTKEDEIQKEEQYKISLFLILGVVIVAMAIIIERLFKIRKQKSIIEEQHENLNEAHSEVTDSINYANWIQTALLKTDDRMAATMPDHFILFQPKDIVSGDFYWVHESSGYQYFCVADCTGHGVPGAFMSMLGMSFLQEIFTLDFAPKPSELMNLLSEKFIKALSQKPDKTSPKDGMDMSLVRYQPSTMTLDFCGANNGLFLVSERDYTLEMEEKMCLVEAKDDATVLLTELLSQRQPVGYHASPEPFVDQSIKLNRGDSIYLYTDGFSHQFGGENHKKYTHAAFRKLILTNSIEAISDQQQLIRKELDAWKGNYSQVDDVCVMGIRF